MLSRFLLVKTILKNRWFQLFNSNRSRKKIFIDLRGFHIGRYLYIYTHFLAGDFRIYLTIDVATLKNLNDYSEWIPDEPNIFLTTSSLGKSKIVVKDRELQRTFDLDFNCFSKSELGTFHFPYVMHPGFYRFKHINDLAGLRQLKRTLNVFFVGGFEKQLYDSNVVYEKFGTPNRWESVQFLLAKRNDIFIPKSLQELDNTIDSEVNNSITLVDTSNFFIMQPRLQQYYGRAKFHLSLPGVVMPMCHNVIEAMVVGCIPILSYADLFWPNLEHEKNCLLYRNLEELNELLNSISMYSDEKLLQMKREVIQYYDEYLDVRAFRRNFNEFLRGPISRKVYWNVEHGSVHNI